MCSSNTSAAQGAPSTGIHGEGQVRQVRLSEGRHAFIELGQHLPGLFDAHFGIT